VPSSGIFSPGTDAADCEPDRSLTSSSCEIHAEMRNVTASNKTAGIAMRLITAGERSVQHV